MNFLIARGQFIIITESQHDDNCNCDKQQKARNKSLLIINERRTRRDELLASGWMMASAEDSRSIISAVQTFRI